MKKNFSGNEYNTPNNLKISWLARIMTSFYFYWKMFMVILWCRKKALANELDLEHWCEGSSMTKDVSEKTGANIQIKGLDNISAIDGPVIFIGNHMSTLETFILPSIIVPFKKFCFVVKEALLDMPFFGPTMRAVNPIAVTRKNVREDLKTVMKKGQEYVKQGFSICIFPQSTRMNYFDENLFNTLGVKLASKCGVPVIPLALKTDMWGNGKILKEFGKIDTSKQVYFSFGKAIMPNIPSKEMQKQVVEFIVNELQQKGVKCITKTQKNHDK